MGRTVVPEMHFRAHLHCLVALMIIRGLPVMSVSMHCYDRISIFSQTKLRKKKSGGWKKYGIWVL